MYVIFFNKRNETRCGFDNVEQVLLEVTKCDGRWTKFWYVHFAGGMCKALKFAWYEIEAVMQQK